MNQSELKSYLDRIPYARTLGVEPQIEDGQFSLRLPFLEDNIGNPFLPALHGGVIGGFMEITAIMQVMLSNGTTEIPKPIGINVDYLRPGRPEELFARAQIARQGSRVANVRVRAWQDNFDKPVAALHGHFLTDNSADR